VIIHLSPDAPLLLRAAATGALVLHIGGGCVGLVSGAVALTAPKGGRLHRVSGNVFFASMLVAYLVGAAAAPFLRQWANVFGGLFSAYLVATAWATVMRPAGRTGRFEVAAMCVPLGATAATLWFGWIGANSPHGLIQGVPYQAALAIAAIAGFAAALDLRVILKGGLSGAARISRHLWRMCTGLFFAAASFFIGQPQVFPPPLHGSPILFVPPLAVVAAMVFWLVRVRIPARPRRSPQRRRTPAATPLQEGLS
jgi:uncharacterized membrane protein